MAVDPKTAMEIIHSEEQARAARGRNYEILKEMMEKGHVFLPSYPVWTVAGNYWRDIYRESRSRADPRRIIDGEFTEIKDPQRALPAPKKDKDHG